MAEAAHRIERVDLFATPVHRAEHPEAARLNPAVAAYVLARQAREPSFGAPHSNRGGWHSPPDLAQVAEPAVRSLCDWMFDRVRDLFLDVTGRDPAALPGQWGMQAWAMVLSDGAYAALHDHADALWSGVYYVDVGEAGDAAGGVLGLVDPRVAVARRQPVALFPSDVAIPPVAGSLVTFPGWLRHHVTPYAGARPRISVSFNVVWRAAE